MPPTLLRHPKPGIADVQCSRLTFQPGDRIMVRTHSRLDESQKRKLRKSIVKWAGCEVEVFVYSLLDMEIEVDQRSRRI